MINTQRLVDRFLKYIACDSESRDEKQFCELIERELSEMGLETSRDQAGERCGSNGWNVYASLPGEGEPLLLCAHMDTVSPGKGICPVIKEDGVIYSQGNTILGADDKCGISAIMEAIQTIQECEFPHRPVEVLFTICEEVGLLGSRNADYCRLHSKQAVVLDSGIVEELINRAPANMELNVEIFGRASHAGVAPEEGIHALKAAAAAVAQIPCGQVDELTVMNVSNFLSPGKTNVVPDYTSFDMEIRSFDEEQLQARIKETEQILKEVCGRTGVSYKLKTQRHTNVLHVPEDTLFVKRLMECCRTLGREPRAVQIFGGSDASWLFANGIDAINIGTGMNKVHSTDEFLSVKEMTCAAQLLLDSGGHYLEGTTDVTRTVALGPLTEEEKKHFTLVLQGMLNLSSAVFPHGCRGFHLDVLAREPLWTQGLDYGHGTGHGIGYLSCVHEPPVGFSWLRTQRYDTGVLEPGMVISDEPGVYIPGSHGIRLENQLLCREAEVKGFLTFEILTLAPIDLDAVDMKWLDESGRVRLNSYHQRVYQALAPYLDREEQEWLASATRAI